MFTDEDNESSSSSSSSDSSDDDDDELHTLVLIPPSNLTNTTFVESIDEVVEVVNRRYNSKHFVGGMGEGDPGVWFAPASDTVDLLADSKTLELLGTSMERCRQERHGVPFNVYTSGINVDPAAVAALKWDSVQVSLWAATPADYAKCTGRHGPDDSNLFGAVCGFIAEASDLGLPVEVSVLKQYAGPARDLASSLGARHVHVYEENAETFDA